MERLPRKVPTGDLNLTSLILGQIQGLVKDAPIIGDLIEIFTGVEDGNLNDLGSWVLRLMGNGTSSAAAIAALQAQLAAGSSWTDDFDRPNSSTLGNGWVQGGNGQGLGIIGDAARIDNTGNSVGRRYAIAPVKSSADAVTVAVAVNNAGVAVDAMTTILICGNEDMTQFVYANLYGKSAYMGTGTRSGNTWTFNDFPGPGGSTNEGVGEGALVEFSHDGNNGYTLYVNKRSILRHTDTSGYPVGANHRSVGFASETRTIVGPLFPRYSWGLAAFALRSSVEMTGIGPVSDTANDAQETARQAAAAVAELKAENNTSVNEGVTRTQQFQVGDGLALPNFSVSSGANIYVVGNLAKWQTNVNGTGYARYNTNLTGDDQEVSLVFGERPNTTAPTSLFLRSTSNLSSFAYVHIWRDKLEFGRGQYSGGTFTWTPLGSATGLSVPNGATAVFRAVGDNYTVVLNGYPYLNATATQAQIPRGEGYFSHGMLFWCVSFLGVPFKSSGVYQYSVSDLFVPETQGIGWDFYRSNPGNSPQLNRSGHQPVPYDTFDNARNMTAGIYTTIAGRQRIRKAGFYTISARLEFDTNTTAGGVDQGLQVTLYRERGGTPQLIDTSERLFGDQKNGRLDTIVYLEVNDIVFPGYYHPRGGGVSQVAPIFIVGDTLGTVTYFKGALVG